MLDLQVDLNIQQEKQKTYGGKFWSTRILEQILEHAHMSRIQRLQPGHAHQNWTLNPRIWSCNIADKQSKKWSEKTPLDQGRDGILLLSD